MLNQQYCSEIESILIQFISAFNDGTILRPSKTDADVTEHIVPRWVVSGKSAVFTDIINQAGNITLPAAVVEPNSIKLDTKRIFNKQLKQLSFNNKDGIKYKQPTPITLSVSVTFYSSYFNDIWQMLSNFAVYSNPYVFISWTTPTLDKTINEELRCKVEWDGNYSIDYPKTLSNDKNWLISATSNFEIECWLFEAPVKHSNLITNIDLNLTTNGSTILHNTNNEWDYYSKAGWPSITNIIGVGNEYYKTNIDITSDDTLLFEGRSFFREQCTGILLVPLDSQTKLTNLSYVTIDTIKHGQISGYDLCCNLEIQNENIIKITIPNLNTINPVKCDIIIYNNAGYVSLKESQGIWLNISQ